MPTWDVAAIWSAVSVGLWELGKQLFGALLKRSGEKTAALRKQLGDQCNVTNKGITDCVGKAVEFLTADCTPARRDELSRTIVHEVKVLALAIAQINTWAAELNAGSVHSASLISFRQAVTWHLKSQSFTPKAHTSADVSCVYDAAKAFQAEVTRLHVGSV